MSYIYKPTITWKRFSVAEMKQVSNPAEVVQVFKQILGPVEKFSVLYLNVRNNVLDKLILADLFNGTVDQCAVFTRNILEMGLYVHATSLIIAHNHPSGAIVPSPADDVVTKRVKDAAKLLDMTLLDSLIISEESYFSYSQSERAPF